jgi:hypothetical protein|tara:strand:- start:645 stop:833 length:189 start_codon:yes stop_codon:yes gene_type:complete
MKRPTTKPLDKKFPLKERVEFLEMDIDNIYKVQNRNLREILYLQLGIFLLGCILLFWGILLI